VPRLSFGAGLQHHVRNLLHPIHVHPGFLRHLLRRLRRNRHLSVLSRPTSQETARVALT
jgi:hypothetical protein